MNHSEIIAEIFLLNPLFWKVLKTDQSNKSEKNSLVGIHFSNIRLTCKLFSIKTPYLEAGKIILGDQLGCKAVVERLFGLSSTAINRCQFYPNLNQPTHHKFVRLADAFEMAFDPITKVLKSSLVLSIFNRRQRKAQNDALLRLKNEEFFQRYQKNRLVI